MFTIILKYLEKNVKLFLRIALVMYTVIHPWYIVLV